MQRLRNRDVINLKTSEEILEEIQEELASILAEKAKLRQENRKLKAVIKAFFST